MTHCALCFSDGNGRYFRHAYITLLSLLENASGNVHVHIVSDETLAANEHYFRSLCEQFGQQLSVHLAPAFPPEVESLIPPQYGRAALYRFILHEILDVPRVVYLDCDIIVERDIRELGALQMGQACLGAVRDYPWPLKDVKKSFDHSSKRHVRDYRKAIGVDSERYFNTGVLLMNLDRIRERCREENIYWKTFRKQTAIAPPMYADQDSINGAFNEDDVLFLDTDFNYIIADGRKWQSPEELRGKIIHFTNWEKPWAVFYPPALLYWKYFNKSPWASEWFEEFMRTWGKASSHNFLMYVARHPKIFRRIRDVKEFGLVKAILAHTKGKRLN